MKPEQKNIHIQYTVHKRNGESISEKLPIMKAAEDTVKNAYAPYSGFKVGAAVLLEDGRIVSGSNQENAAYPSGLCAERVALFTAASHFPDKKIETIAVAAEDRNGNPTPVTPCGSCRQVMLEYETKQHQPIEILLAGPDQTILQFNGTEALLPMGFKTSQLK
ncbi:MAG: cytidine deaminase [Cyclobacteriaceae bacterium]|nr:cytidine deaminase [Cyclobacteriaceae bacterium]